MTITDKVKDVIAGITHDFSNKAYVTKVFTTVLDDVCEEQGVSEEGMAILKERIEVGEKGELNYTLFPLHYQGKWVGYPEEITISFPGNHREETLHELDEYAGAIQEYLTTAKTLAQAHGFRVVYRDWSRNGDNVYKSSKTTDIKHYQGNSYRYLTIGTDETIASAEKIADFITMVVAGHHDLDEKLQVVIEKTKPLPKTKEWTRVIW
jgi:hypothetical protein